MEERPPRVAGGCLLAGFTLLGAAIGVALGEASAGLLSGFATGAVLAIFVAIWDSRRGSR